MHLRVQNRCAQSQVRRAQTHAGVCRQHSTITVVCSHTYTLTRLHTHTHIHKHTNAATRPPARCLNKNPPTTPDVHHRLSWPPRNILQGCRGNSLGNSLPACHLSDETMIIYVFFIATSGCVCVCVCVYVCVCVCV